MPMFEETSGANSNPSSLIAVFLSHLRGQYTLHIGTYLLLCLKKSRRRSL